MEQFSLTEAAAKRIKELLKEEGKESLKFRISVLGGGCSGFQYDYSFIEASSINVNDKTYSLNGADVIIDEISLDLLKGSVLDYTEDLGRAGFEIKNPNISAKCGCGNSFAI
jgi:iron-sulfur cluster insertion protein